MKFDQKNVNVYGNWEIFCLIRSVKCVRALILIEIWRLRPVLSIRSLFTVCFSPFIRIASLFRNFSRCISTHSVLNHVLRWIHRLSTQKKEQKLLWSSLYIRYKEAERAHTQRLHKNPLKWRHRARYRHKKSEQWPKQEECSSSVFYNASLPFILLLLGEE